MTELEFSNWKSQIVMSNSEKMGLRKMPFAFTEQGVAMLSAVLRTKTAIKVSLAIMDAFVQLRHLMMGNGGLVNRYSKEHVFLYARRFHVARSAEGIAENSGRKRKLGITR